VNVVQRKSDPWTNSSMYPSVHKSL
jgi:hypothetical protein